MAKSTVNKVTVGETPEETKEKGRIDFPIKDAKYRNVEGKVVTAVNGDGVLIAVPIPVADEKGKVIYAGFNARKHLPLKKADFASLATYLRYQGFIAKIKAHTLVKRAEECEAKAARIEQYGDEATRKKVAKLARMREAAEKIQKQLEEEGVDLTGMGDITKTKS